MDRHTDRQTVRQIIDKDRLTYRCLPYLLVYLTTTKMAIQGNPRFRNVLIVGNTEDDQIFGED